MKATLPASGSTASRPAEIQHIATVSKLPLEETLRRLKAAGLDSIPGGGAEILVRPRAEDPRHRARASTAEWLEVMETAHRLGMRTTATMMFGHVETLAERIDHLHHLRDLQDRTGGFTAFIGWTFQPENTALAGDELTSFEYLRTLAVSRVLLDNFPNVQASWVTQGSKIGQVSLRFGANDFGSLMIEENVVSAAGRALPPHRGRDRPRHPGGRLRPQAPDDGLPHRGRPVLLEPRDARAAGRPRGRDLARQLKARRSGSVAQPAGRDVLVAGSLLQGGPVGLRLLELSACGQDPGACLLGSATGEDENSRAAGDLVLRSAEASRAREARMRPRQKRSR